MQLQTEFEIGIQIYCEENDFSSFFPNKKPDIKTVTTQQNRLTSKTVNLRNELKRHTKARSPKFHNARSQVSKMLISRHNDVSFITGRQLHKLRRDPETSGDLEFESVHQNLKSIRTKFDNAKTKRIEMDQRVSRLEQEVKKYRKAEDEFNLNKVKGKQAVQGLNGGVANTKYQFQEKDVAKKVLLQMMTRHNKDKIFYDQKKFDLNKKLQFVLKQNSLLKIDGKDIFETSDRAKKLCEKLVSQLNEQQTQRWDHLNSVSGMIEEKRKVFSSNQIRDAEMTEIAERAIQDKDETEKAWGNILLSHKLVAKLLRDKMYKEMEKFRLVETAFKNIKISTGITEASVFTFKFLNKEAAYGELLGKIATNETSIERLKLQAEDLNRDAKQLQEEEKQLLEMRRKDPISVTKQMKEFEGYDEKRQEIDLKKRKLKLWLLRNIKKFRMVGEIIQNLPSSNSLEDVMILFKKHLNLIDSSLENLKENPIGQQTGTEGLNPKMTDHVFRVRTHVKRKNSIGQEIDIKFEQEYLQNPQQENDNVDFYRNEVLRNNDKFMKMLKIKYEEIRRAQIQAMPKEKKKEPQKPKVVEVDS